MVSSFFGQTLTWNMDFVAEAGHARILNLQTGPTSESSEVVKV